MSKCFIITTPITKFSYSYYNVYIILLNFKNVLVLFSFFQKYVSECKQFIFFKNINDICNYIKQIQGLVASAESIVNIPVKTFKNTNSLILKFQKKLLSNIVNCIYFIVTIPPPPRSAICLCKCVINILITYIHLDLLGTYFNLNKSKTNDELKKSH